MQIYIFILMVTVILGSLMNLNKEKNKLSFLIVIMGLLSIIAGLRNISVGLDTISYSNYFEKFKEISLIEALQYNVIEKGYILYSYFFAKLTGSMQILLFFSSVITNTGFGYWIYKRSKDILISTTLYIILIYPFTLNALRQSIAIALILIVIINIQERKIKSAICIVIFAISFHTSAAIFILFFLFCVKKEKIKNKYLGILTIFLIVFLFLGEKIIYAFTRIFSRYAQLLNYQIFTRSDEISYVLLFVYGFIFILSFAFVFIENKGKSNKNKEIEILFLYGVFVVLYYLASKMMIVQRIKYYFIASILIIIPYVLSKFSKGRWIYKIIQICISICLVYLGIYFFENDGHGILPYLFFWEG